MLGDAAPSSELFLTELSHLVPASALTPCPHITRDERPWGPGARLAAYEEGVRRERENADRERRGEVRQWTYR